MMDINIENQNNNSERHLGFLVQDVARLMRLAFDRRVREVGLTGAQWTVLCQVIRLDGQRQIDLSQQTGMDKAPLGKLLDRLEVGGWIERRPDPQDRRVRRVFATRKIDPLAMVVKNEATELFDIALTGFDAASSERLLDDLVTIKANLESNLREAEEKQPHDSSRANQERKDNETRF